MQPQDPYNANPQPQQPEQVPPVNPPIMSQPQYAQPAPTEDPGKTLSLVGVITAVFIPIVGIPLAAVGMSKSKGAGYSGKLGLAGIIVGVVSILLSLVVFIALPIMAANSLKDQYKQDGGSSLDSSPQETELPADSTETTPSSGSSSSSKPSAITMGECMQAKNVDPNDFDAYLKASKECEAGN